MLKRRATLQLKSILTGEPKTDQISRIDRLLKRTQKPLQFYGNSNSLIKYVKDYEETIAIIRAAHSIDPKSLNTLEFFQLLDTLKKMKPKKGRRTKSRTGKKR